MNLNENSRRVHLESTTEIIATSILSNKVESALSYVDVSTRRISDECDNWTYSDQIGEI